MAVMALVMASIKKREAEDGEPEASLDGCLSDHEQRSSKLKTTCKYIRELEHRSIKDTIQVKLILYQNQSPSINEQRLQQLFSS